MEEIYFRGGESQYVIYKGGAIKRFKPYKSELGIGLMIPRAIEADGAKGWIVGRRKDKFVRLLRPSQMELSFH